MLHIFWTSPRPNFLSCPWFPFILVDNPALRCSSVYHQCICLFYLLCSESFCNKTWMATSFEINLQWAEQNRWFERHTYIYLCFVDVTKTSFNKTGLVNQWSFTKTWPCWRNKRRLAMILLLLFAHRGFFILLKACISSSPHICGLGFWEVFQGFHYGRFNSFCSVWRGQD